jgi:hypothetical protein
MCLLVGGSLACQLRSGVQADGVDPENCRCFNETHIDSQSVSGGDKVKYVDVTVIDPDKREYEARIDADAGDEALVRDLVRKLNLRTVADDGETPIEYGINVLGGARIREKATIQLYRAPMSSVAWIRPRKKR